LFLSDKLTKVDCTGFFHKLKIVEFVVTLKEMQKDKYILITGGAGFIGSHTYVELIKSGYTPVIADDLRNSSSLILKNLEAITGRKTICHQIDVCDVEKMNTLFERYNFYGIIHFAAYKAVGESVKEPLKYYENNILSLVQTLKLAVKYRVNNFVFSSSCTVYGAPDLNKGVTEDQVQLLANAPYGQTKIIGELILNDFHNAHPECRIVALRYFNPIGAHPSGLIGELPIGTPNNLLPFITQTAIGKLKQLTVFGNDYNTEDGTCIRDYIHVCDLAAAHVKALEYTEKSENGLLEFINVGTGNGNSVLEVIEEFEKVSQLELNYKIGPRRPGDVPAIYANTEKSKHLLNWNPKYSLTDAVIHAWNWEKNMNNEN
jgi:UDP-glucose 4-epimerase